MDAAHLWSVVRVLFVWLFVYNVCGMCVCTCVCVFMRSWGMCFYLLRVPKCVCVFACLFVCVWKCVYVVYVMHNGYIIRRRAWCPPQTKQEKEVGSRWLRRLILFFSFFYLYKLHWCHQSCIIIHNMCDNFTMLYIYIICVIIIQHCIIIIYVWYKNTTLYIYTMCTLIIHQCIIITSITEL